MTTDNNTAVAVRRPTGALAVTDGQVEWNETQRAALAQIGVGDAPLGDQLVLLHRAQTTGLDPFSRQIYMIERREKKNGQWVTKWGIQTGIDGFRVTARRAAKREGDSYTYEDPLWCGSDGLWVDVWLGEGPPRAAKFAVVKTDAQGRVERFAPVAKWESYVQTSSEGNPTGRWRSGGDQMLSKCAEALALRMAYPHDLSGIYTDDEMDHLNHRVDQRTGELQQDKPTPQRRRQWLKQFQADLDSAGHNVAELRRLWKVLASAEQREYVTVDDATACRNRILAATAAAKGDPADQDIADAEVVPPSDGPAEPTARVLISQDQSKRMHVQLTRHGVTVRDDKLDLLSRLAGRKLESSSDLSAGEAETVIGELLHVEDFATWFTALVERTEPVEASA